MDTEGIQNGYRREIGMRKQWRRWNWLGLFGAFVMFGIGWAYEPLAAVLGGLMLATDVAVGIVNLQ